VFNHDIFRIGPRQRRDHLTVVAPGRTPSGLSGLDNRDVHACLAQMQRGREAGETGADHDDVGLLRAYQFRKIRP
jgi:hypothetical protein